MKAVVVISYWTGNPIFNLHNLLSTMDKYEAGVSHKLCLCVNGNEFFLPSELEGRFEHVFIRENRGFNLGAWDHAWRQLPDYDYFLFIQDDCVIEGKSWLFDFVCRYEGVRNCGLVGENYNRKWNHKWADLINHDKGFKPSKTNRAIQFMKTMENLNLPVGEKADHITTVVQFTSREVLEKVDGYNTSDDYEEAIACEIGFSKKVQKAGWKIVQLDRIRHRRIGHPQWNKGGLLTKLSRSIKKRLSAASAISV